MSACGWLFGVSRSGVVTRPLTLEKQPRWGALVGTRLGRQEARASPGSLTPNELMFVDSLVWTWSCPKHGCSTVSWWAGDRWDELANYWATPTEQPPPLSIDTASLRLFEAQHGRCQICGDWLLSDNDRPQKSRQPARQTQHSARREPRPA